MNGVRTLRSVAVIPATATEQEVRSEVFTETYTLDDVVPTVVANSDPAPDSELADGTKVFNDKFPAVSLNVTNDEPGPVKIYYTTDGSAPVVGGRNTTLYANPINVRKDTTLKFMAIDAAGNPSSVIVTEAYKIVDTQAPGVPTALALAAASDTGEDQGFSITTSALDPGRNIPVTATATDPSGNEGAAATLSITIDTTNPTVSASPGGGTYPRAQSVTLEPSETAKVYYTRNGGAPNPGAAGTTQATGAIDIAANTTLRFIAVDTAGNRSGVVMEAYRIRNALPTITTFSPAGVVNRDTNIRATVRDSDSQLAKANITLTVDGARRTAFTYNASNGAQVYGPRFAPGRHNVTITVRDQDGGAATKSWSFRV